MQGALMVSWGTPVRGREAQGLACFEVTLCAGGSDQAVGEMVTRFTETMSAMGYM